MIRVGVGGWTFEPWRGVFYPAGLRQADELAFMAGALTSVEVNGTFYRTQTPATFASWAAATPDDFVFSLKGPRYAVNRRVLADAAESIERFVASGLDALGDKLGPLNWQLSDTKAFDREDIAAFLALLPARLGARPLRHAIEPRHESFADPAFEALCRDHGVAIVWADAENYPAIGDPETRPTADFAYVRLQRAGDHESAGYHPAALDGLAAAARAWDKAGGDAFVYFISGAKVRNPAAARGLIERLG